MSRKFIEIIARGVCVKNGKILLCHGKGRDNTYLPGGHIEFKESAADALAREIQEEMGVKSRVGRFLGCCEHTFKHKGERTCEVNVVFLLDIPSVSPDRQPPSMEDYIEFIWVPLKGLARARMQPAVLVPVLQSWLAAKAGPGWASTY